ncbi:MAG: sulfatase-like hydrolase/transferase, partial [Planctomycetaceae bacterium]|nr:sulfatase-like hydrolase/transferase [Planctomycetaceae bacterium]
VTRRKYAAQVSLLDDAIGQTLEALRQTEQDRNTLVFFFSDNGGPITKNGSNNAPLRGGKGDVYEGGVRVPFVVRWPARFRSGSKYEFPVSSLDVFATSLAAADVQMPSDRKYDTANLIPYLSGERTGPPHDDLFWRNGPRQGIRDGGWKLVETGPNATSLYELQADVGESQDRLAEQAEVAMRLKQKLDAWDAEMIPPAFPGATGRANRKTAAPSGGR